MKTEQPIIESFDSGKPGKITTIMAGVHGNERSGVIALEKIRNTLEVFRGKVILVLQANPRALNQDVRFTEKNMNRAFFQKPQGDTHEERMAQKIIPVLLESDVLLDVHNTLDREISFPFLISEHRDWNKYFPVSKVVSGLDGLHPGGSDSFMNSLGKVGICFESGSIYDRGGADLALYTIKNFLKATGNIVGTPEETIQQTRYQLDTIVKSHNPTVQYTREWSCFDDIVSGEMIVQDGEREVRAPYDGTILFPYGSKKVGDEICLFGRKENTPQDIVYR